jgi:hypothetical protein
MPGIATLFQVLDLTIARLDPQYADVMNQHSGYAHFGALGASIGDFLPADPVVGVQPHNYAHIWKVIFNLLADTPNGPGLLSTLTTIRDLLNQLQPIVDNEDFGALVDFKNSGQADKINPAMNDLRRLVGVLVAEAPALGQMIAQAPMRPAVDTWSIAEHVPDRTQWQARDFLHWKKTGTFVRNLLDKAAATGDPRLQAYAYGYLVSYACKVCGSPFINSIVGGPYRTQWWRQRLVRNFVDAWVYGFYQASPRPVMQGDVPSPTSPQYPDWPFLCDANLQDKLTLDPTNPIKPIDLLNTVGGTGSFPAQHVVPDDFAQSWFEVVQQTYDQATPLNVGAGSLNGAYLMTWLMLWFQSSGALLGILGCRPVEPIQPPGGCGVDPKDITPFHTDQDGNPNPPQAPSPDPDTNVCGDILAFLDGLGFIGRALGGGGEAIVSFFGISPVHWGELRCTLWWFREFFFNALVGLQDLVAATGFGYPDPKVFQSEDPFIVQLGAHSKTLDPAVALVKARPRQGFPSNIWIQVVENDPTSPNLIPLFFAFEKDPDASDPGFEQPQTFAYLSSEVFPSFFVDDDVNNPLSHGDVKTGGGFPMRQAVPTAPYPVQFGNAVANAVDLFKNIGMQFPNWNLDGDRGLAWFTWQFHNNVYDPGNVQPDHES